MQQSSHGGGGDSYYYPLQLPPRTSSLKATAYTYPSNRTSKRWSKPFSSNHTERANTPAIQVPQYSLLNPPQRTHSKGKRPGNRGVVYYPSALAGATRSSITPTPSTPREWETEAETDSSTRTTSSGNRRSSARYAQRLRKKGKRVRFVPQPTEVPAADRGGEAKSSGIMGSSISKPILGSSSRSRRRSSRDQQPHHAQYVVTDPYSTTRRRGHASASGEASSSSHGQGTYAYTYTYPQYPLQSQYTPNQHGYQYPPTYSTYEPGPESAYYLGTETFPALHSLGTSSQLKSSGKTRTRSRLPPEYASGIYNSEYYAPPPVYRHQHRGTTVDGGYYITSDPEGSRRDKKREREESLARNAGGSGRSRSGSGREKKLRRAKGVDDIRGRSLRGGYQRAGEGHAYGGGWISVGA